jgi:pyruvate ferredoxin oxidoreductase gamma subunit/2-oxoisovalerate ferredoxin oxidoreductase gamma subunit
MVEIRIHGLGGQGVVTMSEILALACYYSGSEAQSFPWFGPERTGAPVTGFIRLDNKPIRLRSQIYSPDIIIVTDEKLLTKIDVSEGAKTTTKLIINTALPHAEISKKIKLKPKCRSDRASSIKSGQIICYNSSAVVADKRLSNSAMLGFVAKTMNLASLANCALAIKAKLKDKEAPVIKANTEAMNKGYANK